MTKRPTINTLTNTASPTYLTQLNQNFTNVKNQFDNTLSLDGSLPNAMNADLDLNGNDLINGGTLSADKVVVGGIDLTTQVSNAAASATSAAASAATATAYTPAYFNNFTALKADTRTWPVGQLLNTRAEGFAYQVVSSGEHVTTTGGAKLIVLPTGDGYNIKAFGAVGDGTTNDQAAIQVALNTGKSVFVPDGIFFFGSPISFTADGQSLFGNGNNSVLKSRGTLSSGPSWISVNAEDDVSIFNLQIDGGTGATTANPGIWVEGGSSNFTVDGCLFKGGNQVVYLGTCSNVKVVNNTFDGTYYGVIQRSGFVSSHVLIDGNTCLNSFRDFVEANCTSAAPSENWIVSNNTFDTNQNYPTAVTEGRFVGITSVRGVVITGNTVKKVAGDAAIHLEDTLGNTVISSNIFDNCLVSGGNNGYLYLLNSAENTVVSDNIFLRTDAALSAVYALSVDSNTYSNSLVITGNLVQGVASGGNLSGFNLGFQNATSSTTCVGNSFVDVDFGILASNTNNANITGNSFVRCATGISSGAFTLVNSVVSGNNFVATSGTNDIICAISTQLDVQNNKFSKAVSLGTCTDVLVNDNTFSTTASLVGLGGTRSYANSNTFASLGISQAMYQNTGTDFEITASKRAVLVAGSAVSTFRISVPATIAGWRPGFINIRASACDANGTLPEAAWWSYRFRVLGSSIATNEAVVDSGGTIASYAIAFANVSASATEIVFNVSITAISTDYVVVQLSASNYNGINSVI